jgi:hypothetical protein
MNREGRQGREGKPNGQSFAALASFAVNQLFKRVGVVAIP